MIRNANLDDLDSIIEIEKQFGADSFSRSCLRRFIVLKKLFYMPDIGYYIILTRQNSNRARLYSIAVAENAKGKGYGRQLLRHAELQSGRSKMGLEVSSKNTTALGLYLSTGYVKIGELKEYYVDKSMAYKLEKTLDN
jgi:ribosomal protein S18 acetylase RimI-like enzyme